MINNGLYYFNIYNNRNIYNNNFTNLTHYDIDNTIYHILTLLLKIRDK